MGSLLGLNCPSIVFILIQSIIQFCLRREFLLLVGDVSVSAVTYEWD